MANRSTLHKSHLNDFKAWLILDGWTICEPKGCYEVCRATKPGKHTLIVWRRHGGDHYTVSDKFVGIIRQFTRSRKVARGRVDNGATNNANE